MQLVTICQGVAAYSLACQTFTSGISCLSAELMTEYSCCMNASVLWFHSKPVVAGAIVISLYIIYSWIRISKGQVHSLLYPPQDIDACICIQQPCLTKHPEIKFFFFYKSSCTYAPFACSKSALSLATRDSNNLALHAVVHEVRHFKSESLAPLHAASCILSIISGSFHVVLADRVP